MATFLYRIGKFAYRKKFVMLLVWLLGLIAIIAGIQATDPKFSKEFNLPGTESQRAMELMATKFPNLTAQQSQASTTVLVEAADGLQAHRAQLDALVADLRGLPDVVDPKMIVSPLDPAAKAAGNVNGDGTVGLVSVKLTTEVTDIKPEQTTAFADLLDKHRSGGLNVEATGALMFNGEPGGSSEMIGFVVAFIVMIVAFGALVAAFLPIITAIVGVAISMLSITLGSGLFDVNENVSIVASMIGIAVAIDYALFIVSRYRNELHRMGDPTDPERRADAVGRAVGTAGTSVVFAGLTVIIALSALSLVGIPFITQMGLSAAVAVVVSVLGAITLLPAILGLFGRFAFKGRIRFLRDGTEPEEQESNGRRWARFATRFPVPIVVIGLAMLAVAAIPATNLQLGMEFTSDKEKPAVELLKKGFGEGYNSPLFIVVDASALPAQADRDAAFADAVAHIKTLPNVAQPDKLFAGGNGTPSAQDPTGLKGATAAFIPVTPQTSGASAQTHDLMVSLRDYNATFKEQTGGADLVVAGETAILSDLSEALRDALIPYLLVVVGLAFLVLMLVFRSILVPLTATLGFLFSVAATFGATVAIFQEGWGGFIEYPAPIISFLPIFLIGMVFGLAMDYQVFLVTRMREEYVHGMSAKDAVIVGFQHGGRVVASAAIIMISVFAAFMLSPDTVGKMMGFALAAAVFFDAFIIRMIVVPAVMALLGEKAWWLPGWLDRILPNVDVEGEKLAAVLGGRSGEAERRESASASV